MQNLEGRCWLIVAASESFACLHESTGFDLFVVFFFFLPVLLQWPLRADPAAEECVS